MIDYYDFFVKIGDMFDEEEVLEWLTDPDTMELNDQIEKVTKKMLEKMQTRSEYLAALFCK